jgi:hypothetical protein
MSHRGAVVHNDNVAVETELLEALEDSFEGRLFVVHGNDERHTHLSPSRNRERHRGPESFQQTCSEPVRRSVKRPVSSPYSTLTSGRCHAGSAAIANDNRLQHGCHIRLPPRATATSSHEQFASLVRPRPR